MARAFDILKAQNDKGDGKSQYKGSFKENFCRHITMKFDCSKEFDLKVIYQKLTSKSHATPMVKACNFFSRQTELQLLQAKMEKVMQAAQKQCKPAQKLK